MGEPAAGKRGDPGRIIAQRASALMPKALRLIGRHEFFAIDS
jgi:hypothetical protein